MSSGRSRSVEIEANFQVITVRHSSANEENAYEGMDLPAATGAAVRRFGAVDFVLFGATVPESHLSCVGAAGRFLSHVV